MGKAELEKKIEELEQRIKWLENKVDCVEARAGVKGRVYLHRELLP